MHPGSGGEGSQGRGELTGEVARRQARRVAEPTLWTKEAGSRVGNSPGSGVWAEACPRCKAWEVRIRRVGLGG